MKRSFALALATIAALCASALAATEHQRVRGTVASIAADELVVHTEIGQDVTVMLGADTHYLKVTKSSLGEIEPGSYIGTATKSVGGKPVALEVVVFPPAMKGAGEGHYPWDKLPDTTQTGGSMAGGSMAASSDSMASTMMTNGSVAAVGAMGQPVVSSMMTNGSVATASPQEGGKRLTVTYKGGEQTILVPPTAPIVTFSPGALSDVTTGAHVFVNVTKDQGKLMAVVVAVGTEGVTPPM